MKYGFIYGLICPIENSYKYIGQTKITVEKRWHYHKTKCNSGKTYKDRWLRKLKRNGQLNKVIVVTLEKCLLSDLDNREIYWINYYKQHGLSLTNSTSGGHCFRHDEATKQKISNTMKGKCVMTHTAESRRKISLSLIGKPGRNTGNRHTDDTKIKISNTKKGTISWNATPILQLSMDNSIIQEWRSAHHAASTLNLSQGNIWSVINGKRKQCGKFKWILKDEYK
jgi:group I intron endonuclease